MNDVERQQGVEPQEAAGRLVLVRKVQQGILASNGAEIVVLGVERDRVKLSFQCPPEMVVLRGEIAFSEVKRSVPTGRGSRRGNLILVRKPDQDVNVGEGMNVKVLGVERDRVKIGIRAAQDIVIKRSELVPPDEKAAFLQSGRTQQ